MCVHACSGQFQLDCTKSADGRTEQCFVAGQTTAQTCDPQPFGDPVKLPILMVRSPAHVNFPYSYLLVNAKPSSNAVLALKKLSTLKSVKTF